MVKLSGSIANYQQAFSNVKAALEEKPHDAGKILDALNAIGSLINKSKQLNTIGRDGKVVSDEQITQEISRQFAKSDDKTLEKPLELSTKGVELLAAISTHIVETNAKLNAFPENDEYRKLYSNLLAGLNAFKALSKTTPSDNKPKLQDGQIDKWLEDKTCEIIATGFTTAQTALRDSICTTLDENNSITAGQILTGDGTICNNKIKVALIRKTTNGSEIRNKMASDRVAETNLYYEYSILNENSDATQINAALTECKDFHIEQKINTIFKKVETNVKLYNQLEAAKKEVTNKDNLFATKMDVVKQFMPGSSPTTYSSSSTPSETTGILASLSKFLMNLLRSLMGIKPDTPNEPTLTKTPSTTAPTPKPWDADPSANCKIQEAIANPHRPVFSLSPLATVA